MHVPIETFNKMSQSIGFWAQPIVGSIWLNLNVFWDIFSWENMNSYSDKVQIRVCNVLLRTLLLAIGCWIFMFAKICFYCLSVHAVETRIFKFKNN